MSVKDGDVAALIASAEAFLAASTSTEVNAVAVTRWELELYRDTLVEHAPLVSTARAFARDVDYASYLLPDAFVPGGLSSRSSAGAPASLPTSSFVAVHTCEALEGRWCKPAVAPWGGGADSDLAAA